MNPLLSYHEPPLSLLTEAQRSAFDRACDIVLFQRGERPLQQSQPSAAVYFIIKGHAQALRQEVGAEQRLADYGPGDVIGAFAVIQGAARFTYEVIEDLLCHAVDAAAFSAAMQQNSGFSAWFHHGLSAKNAHWQAASELDDALLTRVADARLAPAVWVQPEISLREARQAMKSKRVSCVLVERGAGQAPGIVTRTDLLDALALEGAGPEQAVQPWVLSPLLCVDTREMLFQSLVLMTEQQVERVVVRDGEQILGTLGMGEVLSHFSSHSHLIDLELERAESVEAVQAASRRVPELVRLLFSRGARSAYLMDLVSALNTRLFRRLYELLLDNSLRDQVCILVLGSEGRREQILRTDQDNALIYRDHSEQAFSLERGNAFCQAFHQALLGCGFPPCPGKVMLNQPHWQGSQSDWHQRIAKLSQSRDPQQLLDFAILLDARAIAGEATLFEQLRPAMLQAARNDLLLRQFAAAALEFHTPLGLFGRLKSRDDRIDLKKGALFPLVHGLRALALAAGIAARNSLDRLQALVEAGALRATLGQDIEHALAVFQRQRLAAQLEALAAGRTVDNQLALSRLDRLDRELLRDALGVVESFKLVLKQRFRL
ncbi:putative nucleotidyltransferase substrate binding domain-containing protein [Pseudomarimonas arenosa]|uniref:Cyclic nucleotide-binding domain-containing protein n=1 Tax=Pseudomarimonas arenosa TaxID=2774145 RepID=A0AAW3ZQJ3_9GAMM|nr:putative nucleotidyltransferase substrate binding domain-containing protein [Pseudomarimonas arenosa]MBD8526867.1 cyclic nucleotide-binding domain-containing protein [Pseudomarimonas arenosa]